VLIRARDSFCDLRWQSLGEYGNAVLSVEFVKMDDDDHYGGDDCPSGEGSNASVFGGELNKASDV